MKQNTQKIKVFSADRNQIEFLKEVSYQEADEIVKDTFSRGGLVINRKSLTVLTDLGPDVDEIMIISYFAGGG